MSGSEELLADAEWSCPYWTGLGTVRGRPDARAAYAQYYAHPVHGWGGTRCDGEEENRAQVLELEQSVATHLIDYAHV